MIDKFFKCTFQCNVDQCVDLIDQSKFNFVSVLHIILFYLLIHVNNNNKILNILSDPSYIN